MADVSLRIELDDRGQQNASSGQPPPFWQQEFADLKANQARFEVQQAARAAGKSGAELQNIGDAAEAYIQAFGTNPQVARARLAAPQEVRPPSPEATSAPQSNLVKEVAPPTPPAPPTPQEIRPPSPPSEARSPFGRSMSPEDMAAWAEANKDAPVGAQWKAPAAVTPPAAWPPPTKALRLLKSACQAWEAASSPERR